MRLFEEHPRARWVVPAATAALLLAGAAIAPAAVSADPTLPPRTAQELLVDLQQPTVAALSGTVAVQADLGLPELPTAVAGGVGALASGQNTLRVWVDGPDRQRVALLGPTSEELVVRNGTQVWTWSSDSNTATSYQLVDEGALEPAEPHEPPGELPGDLPTTPQEAAEFALDAIDADTEVEPVGTDRVAGRDAYVLGITPRDPDTLVEQVTVAIDAETHLPLRVRIHSTTRTDPALDVGFSDVSYEVPDADLFDFTPPSDAQVRQRPGGPHASGPDTGQDLAAPQIVGSGWSTVLVGELPSRVTDPEAGDDGAAAGLELLRLLPAESGDWGTGRVLRGTLLSIVVTDDGRVALGAVEPRVLKTALAEE